MKPIFAFSGQGAQFAGMGKDLYDSAPAARKVFDDADDALGYSLTAVIFDGPDEELTRTRICQVAIYTMSCACLEAFRAAHPEIRPFAAGGLSLGEYGALYAAGSFSFVEGLLLLNKRAALMDEACAANPGTMASVLGGDESVIREVCSECGIDVANYNSPGQIVISGVVSGIEKATAMLKDKGVKRVIPLAVAGAFHSRLMAPAGEGLKAVLADTAIAMPQVPVYHNFTAEPAKDAAEIRDNLYHQVAGSVRWAQSVQRMIAAGADTMIEFGPGNVLTNLLRRTDAEVKPYNINSFESLNNFDKE
ncbi:MAG: ACP S-malonyltransferase [Victivallaceae bacterium]|nr:ACP S-malonyltransferase [Victivallaceae bacterium]